MTKKLSDKEAKQLKSQVTKIEAPEQYGERTQIKSLICFRVCEDEKNFSQTKSQRKKNVGIYNLIGGADFMRSLFSGLGLPAIGIVFVMMGILVILGTFMEWIAIAFITVPVFAPVVVGMAPELGLEPEWAAVWFGVLFVMNIQIYFLSPPFGPACFWLKSVAPADITLQEIFLSVLPFIALQITGMLLVMFIPDIALWFPKWLGS